MTAESTKTKRTAAPVNENEVQRRVAILKRFRELLTEQRNRFRNYLVVLDKQQLSIESANTEEILSHVDLEEKIVADIFSIQKVIDPLEAMYHASTSAEDRLQDGIPSLKGMLEDLKREAIVRSSYNRDLLSSRIAEIRSEINTLRNNPFITSSRKPVYNNFNAASLVDIKG